MFTPYIQKEADESLLMEHVAALCAHGERVAGSEEEGLACAYILSRLKAWGVSCTVHRFRALVSNPLEACLTLPGGDGKSPRLFSGVGTAFSASTPPEGLNADIVFVGKGREEDYQQCDTKGKIVLVDGLISAAQGRLAGRHHAAGIIGIAEGSAVHKNTTGTVWGRPDFSRWNDIPRLPVLCLNREDGNELAALVRQGLVRGTLHTVTEEEIRVLRLPVADIPGEKPDFILVGAHYCSWFDGATDNATGNAVLLELARLLHSGKKMRFGIRLAWWPGHSQGRFSGSSWYAETFRETLRAHCLGYLNIDSPGSRGARLCLPRYTMAEAMPFVERCLQEAAPERTVSDPSILKALTGKRIDAYVPSTRPARQADQSFWGVGLTSFSMYSSLPPDHPDFRSSVGGSGGAWWWHSEADTLDNADSAVLAGDTHVYLHMLRQLADTALLPWDHTLTVRDFSAALRGCEEAANGVAEPLPPERCTALRQCFDTFSATVSEHDDTPDFASLHQSLTKMEHLASRLRARMNAMQERLSASQEKDAASLEHEIDRLNAQCLALGRALVPLLYMPLSCAAEQVPAVGQPLLPDLTAAMQLKRFPAGSPERISLCWEIRRALSHLEQKLNSIAALCEQQN